MSTNHNHLAIYRKRHRLNQDDVSFLLGKYTTSYLSRCEKGGKHPPLELILVYHILFEVSIHKLLPKHNEQVETQLQSRLPQLVEKLSKQHPSSRIKSRLQALQTIISRLSDKTT